MHHGGARFVAAVFVLSKTGLRKIKITIMIKIRNRKEKGVI